MKNREIANIFKNMGTLLQIQGENVFKIKAYHKAADTLSSMGEDLKEYVDEERLHDIPGIGKALQEKILEYYQTNNISAFEKLKKEVPETLLDIVAVPSVGPKKAKLFFDELKITSVPQLSAAIKNGKLEGLQGVQAKSIEKIEKGIALFEKGQERMTVGIADQTARAFQEALSALPEVKKVVVAGSLRRSKETVGDIDLLVDATDAQKVMRAFTTLPQVQKIQAHGETKSSILTDKNIQVDLRIVDPKQFGAALLYFTGSKNFGVKLRQLAQKQNKKVNEYGIFKVAGKKEVCVASETEEDCFNALGLPYVPPELREDIGEKRLWDKKEVPSLVSLNDIQGEFHVHSTYSDGKNTMLEMAEKAQQLGYQYLAISDHSFGLRVAKGVSVADLKKKRKEMDQLNKTFKNFKLLLGAELEIDNDGKLDYDEETRAMLDICIAAVHTGHTQSSQQLTKRLIKAIENKHTHIIAHPFGQHRGKREPYDMDFKAICRAAVEHQVFLEINAFPIRLDLDSVHTYYAAEQGVKFVVNTDAHRCEHMDFMKYGIGVARRGWLTGQQVLNTHSLKDVEKMIKKA